MVTRGTWDKGDDDKKMQEGRINLLHDETLEGIERPQNYGFTSVPLPPSKKQSGSGQGASSSDEMEHAEVFALSNMGGRSLPVILAVDDRRHRPKGLKPGESSLYDDQGQIWHLTRDGVVGKAKKFTLQVGDNTSLTIEDGKITLKAAKVVLDGTVYLGGADADKEASMKGTLDSAGHAEQSNLATKVFVK